MFPKAVRSETITRPALEDKPNLNLHELVKGTEPISSLKSNSEQMPELTDSFGNDIENFKNDSLLDKCTLEESINYKVLDVTKSMSSQEENLSSNFDLFTSMGSTEATDNSPDSIGAQSVSTLTSSNLSLHDNFGYRLYEEFMSEIPTYLKQNAAFVEEDVMKKTKVFLQNLFIESCYQECEENVLKNKKANTLNKKDTPRELIVHDPMDYIRLGHVHQQNLFHQPSRILTTIDGGCRTPHSPLLAPSLPATSPDSPLSVIVNDTPDYTYYPHRLN
ncbi:hypothetical protein PYW08_016177 [Mythimna loreyi]|uniref:Uncharacterized protein n=1 Tax=Mythimna loreyi TaxID=667449 RepID=A0ACC2QSS6_9NEOP|nr:hypothetical protein PYW08_016177 [Mythimna loreyi]